MADSMYKPNSNRYKEEQKQKEQTAEKRAEKVVTGVVTTKKKSGVRKFTEEFISEDAKNIKSYVLGEVLIPAIKKALCDIVTDGINMILYGGSRPGQKRTSGDRPSYVNYSSRDTRAVRDTRYNSSSGYSFEDIILESRAEAEEVLERMDELMDAYGLVRVADLKDLVGVSGPYTDNKWGWTNIRSAEIVRVRDGGYWIKMPRAIPID